MATQANIRILAEGNNVRGDLFARMMSDLFLTLGYDNVRLNVARPSRMPAMLPGGEAAARLILKQSTDMSGVERLPNARHGRKKSEAQKSMPSQES
jgi:hypothetical protein